jgi:hypothetical protein
MCIIIYRPAGAKGQVTKAALQTSARTNSDGYGLMWLHDGKLRIWRGGPGTDAAKEWTSRFLALQKYDLPVAGHARWTTHGISTKSMAHPYWIEKNHSALMHNGILNEPEGGLKHWSDTKTFVERVLRQLPEGWETTPHLKWLVHEATKGSKMLIFRRNGVPILIHGKDGHWDEGIWYSNYGYKGATFYSSSTGKAWEDIEEEELAKPHSGTRYYPLPASKNTTSVSLVKSKLSQREQDIISAFSNRKLVEDTRPRRLYRYEDINICEECLTREVGPSAASLLRELHDPDAQCLLCYGSADVAQPEEETA